MKSKNSPYPLSLLKRSLFTAVIGLALFAFFHWSQAKQEVVLPEGKSDALFYATQNGDDLQETLLGAIGSAEESVYLEIFTLNDDKIIHALRKKAAEGVPVEVHYDKKHNRSLKKRLGRRVKCISKEVDGLMHRKILVTDNSMVWIGSANMTTPSLRVHDNLVVGIHAPELALKISGGSLEAEKEGGVEYWPLPEKEDAFHELGSMLKSAKKTVRVAMFTWTHQDLAREVVAAQKRGVKVEVALDRNSAYGASSKVYELLQANEVPVRLGRGPGLLHHKFCVIDDETLVHGSANWTYSAQKKNQDCLLVHHRLDQNQKLFMNNLWKRVLAESKA